MLNKDEYYNPETANRFIKEIIIAYKRNGPIEAVELLFKPQYTRFRNLAI